MSDSLCTFGLWLTRLLCPWDFSGKNTAVGCISYSRGFSQPRDWTCISFPGLQADSLLADRSGKPKDYSLETTLRWLRNSSGEARFPAQFYVLSEQRTLNKSGTHSIKMSKKPDQHVHSESPLHFTWTFFTFGQGALFSNNWGRCTVHASVQFSHSVVSHSLRPHGLQHTRLLCSSPTPRPCSNPCPLHRWCHPTISSSIVSFYSCLQSFPASGSFPMSQFFASVAKVLEFQLQHQSFQWIFRTDFL